MLLVFSLCALIATGLAELLISEDFDYPDGPLVGNGDWQSHSGADPNDLLVSSGAALINQNGTVAADVNLAFAQQSGVIYYAADVSVSASASAISGSDFEFFIHFKNAGTIFRARVDVVSPAMGGDFRFGLSTSGGTAEAFTAVDLEFGTVYRIVVKYDPVNDQAQLWVDPTAESDPSVSGLTGSGTTTMEAIALRQSSASSDEAVTVDNLAVGTTFASVTPPLECTESTTPCGDDVYSIEAISGGKTHHFCFDFGGVPSNGACSLTLSSTSDDFADDAAFSIDYSSCVFMFDGDNLSSFTLADVGSGVVVDFAQCSTLSLDDGTGTRKRAVLFSAAATVTSATFAVLASGATGDPHLVGAHGEHYEFFGQPGAVYTLFSTPQFVLNMQLWDKGPNDRYIERLALIFRNVTHVFSTAAFHPKKFEQKLNRELVPAGGKAHLSPNHIELELCDGHKVEIVHNLARAQKNAGDIYYLDVAVTVPGCHDAYGGALGQTYQCRYAKGERFVWSHNLENVFRVKSLSAKAGAFARDAPCHDVAKQFAGQSPMSGRSGKV
eukprot:TRINITY_DN1317_c0_g1_i7.p1 TRINITY_DN1317_c0_g1~~TRINITY_DN1317_c0_g1_i7.p1  ORF type:complete len:554 (-),score=190.37 TRINITY_DN1317_c0_g1_i7:95-1756(-)